MDLNQVNWSKIWKEGSIFFAGNAEKSGGWDQNAARWNALSKKDNEYRDQILSRMRVNKDSTVLDIGCGTGLLAVPLAKMAKKVTGLDASKNMLGFLTENAEREHLTNIDIIHKKMEEAVIGKDVQVHDVSIACRSMGHEHDLSKFLIAQNNATRKYAYLTWGASDRVFDIELHKAIGRPYGDTRTYIIIYNLLYQLGIRANIEIFESSQLGMEYTSPEDATDQIIKRYQRRTDNKQFTKDEELKVRAFFNKCLVKTREGNYVYSNNEPVKNALIWWEKTTDLKNH